MQTQTLFLVLVAIAVSAVLVWLQYYYKNKKRAKIHISLSFLRFTALFSTFLLLINPKFTRNEFSVEKTNLTFLLDNSSSIKQTTSKEEIYNIVSSTKEDIEISNKFNIASYTFGKTINDTDTLSLDERLTNISAAIKSVNQIYHNTNTAIVLLSDGNQNIGADYEFSVSQNKFPIYPIVIGDTTTYEDISIGVVNVNKYAFLKNKFPIETFIKYDGNQTISTTINIQINGKNIYSEKINLSPKERTKRIEVILKPETVGVKKISVIASPISNEKNITNNKKNVVLEVIDEKTEIVIVSELAHPDLGTLKKAIETNEQRKVKIVKPSEDFADFDNVDLFILYQPNATFQKTYDYIQSKNGNTFTIVGPKTDWSFLNGAQNTMEMQLNSIDEEVFPILNNDFSIFNISDFNITDFPPLDGEIGDLMISKVHHDLLGVSIRGIDMKESLFTLIDNNTNKEAILFGENIWKWRMQAYKRDHNFENFDDFIGKIILYLSSNTSKERLTIDYEHIYAGVEESRITASYFDESFLFDANATLLIKIVDNTGKLIRNNPMLLNGNQFETTLDNLPSGEYTFSVSLKNKKMSKSGAFSILDFNLEQQFLSSNYNKLNKLAENSKGKLYYPNQLNDLKENLNENTLFTPTQKSKENIVSLIDFRILLGLIIAALTAEWFIRKYNGLI